MNILKEQMTEYLQVMIEACHELWAEYRDERDAGMAICPFCVVVLSRISCKEGCPWGWFTGKTCIKQRIPIGRLSRDSDWLPLRKRQLPRWIAYMEAELDRRDEGKWGAP